MRTLAAVIAFPLLMVTAAQAQISQSTQPQAQPSQQPGQTQSNQTTSIQERVRNNLAQEGFTDITVMPSSFLVRAKDRDGNPIMMIINPDSVTAVTAVPGSRGQTTGRGSSNPGNPSHQSNPSTGSPNRQ